jgi:hypothetical protein
LTDISFFSLSKVIEEVAVVVLVGEGASVAAEEHLEVEEDSEHLEVVAEVDLEVEEEHQEGVDEVPPAVEVRQEVAEAHLEEAVEVVLAGAQREAQTPLSSLTDILVSLLPKEGSLCLSPRTSYQVKQSTEKSVSVLKVPFKKPKASQKRQNTECGILSDPSWQRVYWEVWITFISSLAKRSCTWVQRAVLVLVMSPM